MQVLTRLGATVVEWPGSPDAVDLRFGAVEIRIADAKDARHSGEQAELIERAAVHDAKRDLT